jgi:hypothetical protein
VLANSPRPVTYPGVTHLDAAERDSMAENDKRDRNNLRALVALCLIAALIAGTVMIMQGLHRSTAMQDCLASGRTNCAPIDTNQR